MVVGPRQSGDFIPARSVVEEAFHLLPAADRLVKAVLPERRAFELVLVGQPANGLGGPVGQAQQCCQGGEGGQGE